MHSPVSILRDATNRPVYAFREIKHRRSIKKTQQAAAIDRTNSKSTESSLTAATPKSTSFLPEMHSTPPMYTFSQSVHADLNLSFHTPKLSFESPATPTKQPKTFPTSPLKPPIPPQPLPIRANDRFRTTPPLPATWHAYHDRAICVLDVRNYTLTASVIKMRRTFPELGGVLTAMMIDRRLAQLDQIVEVDYWRVGLRELGLESREGTDVGVEDVPRADSGVLGSPIMTKYAEAVRDDLEGDAENGVGGLSPILRAGTPLRGRISPLLSVPNLVSDAGHSTQASRSRRSEMVTLGFLTGFRSHARD